MVVEETIEEHLDLLACQESFLSVEDSTLTKDQLYIIISHHHDHNYCYIVRSFCHFATHVSV